MTGNKTLTVGEILSLLEPYDPETPVLAAFVNPLAPNEIVPIALHSLNFNGKMAVFLEQPDAFTTEEWTELQARLRNTLNNPAPPA